MTTASCSTSTRAYAAAAQARDGGAPLSEAQEGAISAWEEARTEFKSTPEEIADAVTARTSGYWPAFVRTASINAYFQTWFLYRYFFDLFGMMLIGMALYRLGVLTLERPARLYWAMLALGYGDRHHRQHPRDALDHRPPVQRGLVRPGRTSATISAGWR